jgi:hypothetical protein
LKGIVKSLNNQVAQTITQDPGGNSDSDSDSAEDLDTGISATALHPLAVQVYNDLMHKVRPCAKDHDAQVGHVTNACSGSHAIRIPQKRTAQRMLQICSRSLPQDRFRQRIANTLSTDLRLEVVTKIDVQRLKPTYRDGLSVKMIYSSPYEGEF